MMFTSVLLLALSTFDPSVTVKASTPDAAIAKLASISSPDRPAPVLPDNVFDGLPRPGPGITFEAVALAARRDGKLAVRIAATRDGRRLVRRSYAFTWRTKVPVVVPRRDIAPGEVVRHDDLMLKTLEMSGAVDRYALAPEQLVGRLARITLTKSAPVGLSDVVLPKVVKRGDKIAVQAIYGALTVSIHAVALESGAIGDTIRVRNDTSRKSLVVRITDFETAEVIR